MLLLFVLVLRSIIAVLLQGRCVLFCCLFPLLRVGAVTLHLLPFVVPALLYYSSIAAASGRYVLSLCNVAAVSLHFAAFGPFRYAAMHCRVAAFRCWRSRFAVPLQWRCIFLLLLGPFLQCHCSVAVFLLLLGPVLQCHCSVICSVTATGPICSVTAVSLHCVAEGVVLQCHCSGAAFSSCCWVPF